MPERDQLLPKLDFLNLIYNQPEAPYTTYIERSHLTHIRDIFYLGTSTYGKLNFLRFLVTPLASFDHHSALALILRGKLEAVHGSLVSDYEGLGF